MYTFNVRCHEVDRHPNDIEAFAIQIHRDGEFVANVWTTIDNVVGLVNDMPIADWETVEMDELTARSITLHAQTSNWEHNTHPSLRSRYVSIMNYIKLWKDKHEEK